MRKAKKPKRTSAFEVAKGIRKPMPPPSAVHGPKKYKRPKKDWTRTAE